jgi:hypothetical protein
MSSPNLQLTFTDDRTSLTPLPGHIVSLCTADLACPSLASHRVLSRPPAGAQLLCDDHTLAWASERGLHITTAKRPYAPAA